MAQNRRPAVLVTGAANGIGRAIARHLLSTGWAVGALDLPRAGLSRSFAGSRRSVALIEGDVAV
jgi:NAD(P)-dependent dehydrogenase (short-subunit alcohol dehydrogenase family)